jgi:HK97 family phage major capsid protein
MKATARSMQLRRERARLINEARAILDGAEAAQRNLDAQEQERYDKLDADIESHTERIDREERQAERDQEGGERLEGDPILPGGEAQAQQRTAEQREFRRFLTSRAAPEVISLQGYREERALEAGGDAAGGYTVDQESFVGQLLKFVDDSVFIRQYATVMPVTSAESLGVPTLEADPSDADWTVELDTGSDDSAMEFGKRELRPHPLAKGIKVSRKLLRVSALNVETLVRERLGYKFSVTAEKAYLTGDGAGKPLGMFTASTNGISTSRDVSADNTTTAITADGLINALYSLKEAYQRRAMWMFHRDAIKMIRKLKSNDNQYIWQAGLAGGQPSTILDKPYLMSEFAPNTFTTGLYVGIVGDFSFYWIADALAMEIQRLDELYARTNQVGFVGRLESDGMPALEEAFARVKLA